MKQLNPTAKESAATYAALLEACAKAGDLDPIAVLVETDAYPRVMRIEMVEFIVGWFHGVADAQDLTGATNCRPRARR